MYITIYFSTAHHVRMYFLGCFYYTIGNIHPIYRSHLRVIQLLAVAKTHDIRVYGHNMLLQHFIKQINQLASVRTIFYKCKWIATYMFERLMVINSK